MKIWWMRYKPQDDEEWINRPHASKESAERDACYHIIEKGLKEGIDPDGEDPELLEGVLKFLGLIDLGGYGQALVSYREILESQDWNEDFKVEEEALLSEGDVPLLQALTAIRPSWEQALQAHDEEEDEDDEEDNEGDSASP